MIPSASASYDGDWNIRALSDSFVGRSEEPFRLRLFRRLTDHDDAVTGRLLDNCRLRIGCDLYSDFEVTLGEPAIEERLFRTTENLLCGLDVALLACERDNFKTNTDS